MDGFWPLLWQACAGGVGGGLLGNFIKTKGEKRPILGAITGALGGMASGQGFQAADLANVLRPILQSGMDTLLAAMSDPNIGSTITALLGGGALHTIATRYLVKKKDGDTTA
jgi:hypothetical protein